MARLRDAIPPPDPFGMLMVLCLGPQAEPSLDYSREQLAWGWEQHRDDLLHKARQPGERPWAYWNLELGIEEPATRLERVLALHERGLLTEEERERVFSEAEHARAGGFRIPDSVVITPKEAREEAERSSREHEAEYIAIAEALEEVPFP